MGGNNIYVKEENIPGQINSLNALVSQSLSSDKISEINSLIASNSGDAAGALQNASSTLLSIEESMTDLISATAAMLSSVDAAYEDADTAETNVV